MPSRLCHLALHNIVQHPVVRMLPFLKYQRTAWQRTSKPFAFQVVHAQQKAAHLQLLRPHRYPQMHGPVALLVTLIENAAVQRVLCAVLQWWNLDSLEGRALPLLRRLWYAFGDLRHSVAAPVAQCCGSGVL